MVGGGTEAFPDLGSHCQLSDCKNLDFLPFKCDACQKVFCLEHKSSKSHDCPKADNNSRKVVVCKICSMAIETTGYNGEEEKRILEKHGKSGDCNPAKKVKPRCPVKRCREVLTFSNKTTCNICQIKICLKHRFPADHDCSKPKTSSSCTLAKEMREVNNRFLDALASREGKDYANKGRPTSPPTAHRSVKAY